MHKVFSSPLPGANERSIPKLHFLIKMWIKVRSCEADF